MALDFEIIKTDDPTKLILADLSDWTGIVGSEVDILLPECEVPETLPLNRNIINTFNPADLAVTKTELPDGIYMITIRGTSGMEAHQEKYLRTAKLRLLRDKYILKNIANQTGCLELNSPVIIALSVLDLYIDAAYANLREGDINKAKYYYNRAKERVEQLNCK